MFCRYCGKEMPDDSSFCSSCGSKVDGTSANKEPRYTSYEPYGAEPKKPSTLGPVLLGMFLGILGVIIAVIAYNGNDGPYTSNPTIHALIWSIIGMFLWIPIMFLAVIPFVLAS